MIFGKNRSGSFADSDYSRFLSEHSSVHPQIGQDSQDNQDVYHPSFRKFGALTEWLRLRWTDPQISQTSGINQETKPKTNPDNLDHPVELEKTLSTNVDGCF